MFQIFRICQIFFGSNASKKCAKINYNKYYIQAMIIKLYNLIKIRSEHE